MKMWMHFNAIAIVESDRHHSSCDLFGVISGDAFPDVTCASVPDLHIC